MRPKTAPSFHFSALPNPSFESEGRGLQSCRAHCRALGILDFTGGWTPDGLGTLQDRNVQLWIEAP